ncbi:MAG: 3'-5' exonuclease [Luteolibacter sp.]
MNRHILGKIPFCLLDIETTGFSPDAHEITEIAAICVDERLEIIGEFSQLISISEPIPYHITRITGISDHLLRTQGKPLCETLGAAHAFITKFPTFAHNAKFDGNFLNAASRRHAVGLNFSLECTIPTFKRLLPDQGRYGLPVLAEALAVSGGGAHRALEDCRVLLECLGRVDKMRSP